jgi:hypothetical protein
MASEQQNTKDMKLNEIEKLKQTDKFYEWWDAVGSAIRRYESQDVQEHSLRVARMAWQDRGLLIDNMSDKYLFNRQHTRYD